MERERPSTLLVWDVSGSHAPAEEAVKASAPGECGRKWVYLFKHSVPSDPDLTNRSLASEQAFRVH